MKEKGFFTLLYDFFRSVKLTIFLLILLAIVSIIGTLISQNATPADYMQRYGAGLYEVLDFFGLFDMYHAGWFTAILICLVINLITCSLQRFPGVWNQVFRESDPKSLEDSMLKTLPYVEKVKGRDLGKPLSEEDIEGVIKNWFRRLRRVETESSITVSAEKGRFSRFGVHITHLSLLIILIGGSIGSVYGFRGFVNILEGETIDQVYAREKRVDVPRPIGFSVRCDEFDITYYNVPGKEKYVKEYSSKLSVLENGKQVLQRTIQVNHPLHYKGLAFYQSSYGSLNEITLGVEWKGHKEQTLVTGLEGDTIPIPNANAMVRILKYSPQVHNFGEGVQVLLMRPNQQPRPYWLLRKGSFPKFEEEKGDDFALTFEGISSKEYTGLQVTRDPGVWIVWLGSGLMIFGLIVSFFFSYQRVWVRIPKEDLKASPREIVFAGSANRNRIGFEKTFHQIIDRVRSGGESSRTM